MSARGRKAGFYVYRIFDRFETVYIGKGSGRRLSSQKSKFKCDGEIIERCKTEDQAFKAECKWIAQLKPTQNKHPGGAGKRCKPKPLPNWYTKLQREINAVGSRRYAARFLANRLNETNCEKFGVSKLDVFRIREVANGPWC